VADALIAVADEGAIRTVTVQRPDKLNALNAATLQALADALPAQFRIHPQHMYLQPASTDVGQHTTAQRAVLVMPGQADWSLIE